MATRFEKALRIHTEAKQLVGAAAVEKISKGNTIFIGDGSAPFYFYQALRDADFEGTIWTTNVAITRDYVEKPGKIQDLYTIGGKVSSESANVYDVSRRDHLERILRDCTQSILSLTALQYTQGPASLNDNTRSIWRTVARGNTELHILADHRKLTRLIPPESAVFAGPEVIAIWRQKWLDAIREYLHIYTDVHPAWKGTIPLERGSIKDIQAMTPAEREELAPREIYESNARLFRIGLGDNFIEIAAPYPKAEPGAVPKCCEVPFAR